MEENNTNIWWLNEESEQMLNRGYLLKGETVEGAIDRITTAAAKRLYKPELQVAFKEMKIGHLIHKNFGVAPSTIQYRETQNTN